ncbi:hypothetical protein BH11ACT8_BH11ACT8_14470 [soil metagenome]
MGAMHAGEPVRVAMTKWGGRPHWEFDARWLGEDEHGCWIGIVTGTPMARPGASFTTTVDQVGLVPRPGAGGGAGWVATFHAPGAWVRTYVDMTTVPEWDGGRVHAVDLDLDVVLPSDGPAFVDDEDEFAEHQVRYGYPSETISSAEESCAFVLGEVLAERAPFDGDTPDVWLRRLRDLPDLPDLPRP